MKRAACFLALALSVFSLQSRATEAPSLTVNVLGQVKSPGRFTLPAGTTVLDALASDGDASQFGDLSKVKVIHQGGEKPVQLNVREILKGAAGNVSLRDGDTIHVPQVRYKF